MYLRRKIDESLVSWKADSSRKPLIVKGPRQVGKTESILHFARANYGNVIEINFLLDKKFIGIAERGYTADDIIESISLVDPSLEFVPGDTLIFFDEIQEYPDITTSLKSFCQDGRYDVICSGSLLGVHYKKIHSVSVGYKTDLTMWSMDFEEFLWAMGRADNADDIFSHMEELRPFTNLEMDVYRGLFLRFCVLGGMPAVVARFVEQGNYSRTRADQEQILLDYEEDARKYAEGLDQAKIVAVMRSVPSQLARENKKFQYTQVRRGARARDYSGCIEWLADAGIVTVCRCLAFPELPLKGNVDEAKFKLYYPDTGLLVASLDEEAQEDLRANRNLGVYKGALYENFAAEALLKQDLGLFYYKREDSTLEEDFFVRTKTDLIPVEVKSGNNRAKSMNELITNRRYADIRRGIKFADANVGFANGVYTFPYFCLFRLKGFLAGLE